MKLVLHPSNIPQRPPLGGLIILYLLMQNLGAPSWLYVAFGVFAVLAVVGWVIDMNSRVQVDLFEEAKKRDH